MILTLTISLFICQLCGGAFCKHFTKLVCSIRTETLQDLPLLKMSIAQKSRWRAVIRSMINPTKSIHDIRKQKERLLPLNKELFYHIVKLNTLADALE